MHFTSCECNVPFDKLSEDLNVFLRHKGTNLVETETLLGNGAKKGDAREFMESLCISVVHAVHSIPHQQL